mmetsp:Transcript_9750/g.19739  ORF Transcript_9750/g.19739 Transcript_9750/m.19739 type:complete len:82 (-) Transcript_9750:22-267(-)
MCELFLLERSSKESKTNRWKHLTLTGLARKARQIDGNIPTILVTLIDTGWRNSTSTMGQQFSMSRSNCLYKNSSKKVRVLN